MTLFKKIFILIILGAVLVFTQENPIDSVASNEQKPDSISKFSSPVPSSVSTFDSTAAQKDTTILSSKKTTEPDTISRNSSSTAKEKSITVIEETEEELILDGGEESLIPTATTESVESVVAPADSSKDSTVSSMETQSIIAKDTATGTTTDTAVAADKKLELFPVSPIVPPPKEKIKMQVETPQSINFAHNLKEYRSPKIAILLSLLVPGAGQAYAHNYIKTGIFGAVEVSLITVAAVLGYQGGKKWDKAKSFADDHFSVDRFEQYYSKLIANFSDTILQQIFEPDSNADDFLQYIDNKSRDDDFYDIIRDSISPYIQGWDDAEPEFSSDFLIDNPNADDGHYVQHDDADSAYLVYFVNENGDSSDSQYGFSKNQKLYNDKISEANSKYRWSKNFITLLLINHIASAVDAAITAKAHNDRLLGKNTVWQNINIRESVVTTPSGTANGLAIEVRF